MANNNAVILVSFLEFNKISLVSSEGFLKKDGAKTIAKFSTVILLTRWFNGWEISTHNVAISRITFWLCSSKVLYKLSTWTSVCWSIAKVDLEIALAWGEIGVNPGDDGAVMEARFAGPGPFVVKFFATFIHI